VSSFEPPELARARKDSQESRRVNATEDDPCRTRGIHRWEPLCSPSKSVHVTHLTVLQYSRTTHRELCVQGPASSRSDQTNRERALALVGGMKCGVEAFSPSLGDERRIHSTTRISRLLSAFLWSAHTDFSTMREHNRELLIFFSLSG